MRLRLALGAAFASTLLGGCGLFNITERNYQPPAPDTAAKVRFVTSINMLMTPIGYECNGDKRGIRLAHLYGSRGVDSLFNMNAGRTESMPLPIVDDRLQQTELAINGGKVFGLGNLVGYPPELSGIAFIGPGAAATPYYSYGGNCSWLFKFTPKPKGLYEVIVLDGGVGDRKAPQCLRALNELVDRGNGQYERVALPIPPETKEFSDMAEFTCQKQN